jgi:hypothetical protein
LSKLVGGNDVNVTSYTLDQIDAHPSILLIHEGMILYALLAGGDYEPVRRIRE